MRVLIVNTSEQTGGAAIAAHRLMDALNNNGVKAKMLVRDKETEDITVVGLRSSWLQRWNFLWERWCVFFHLHFSRCHLWEIDLANTGTDITKLREFREADVVHLSWINQGLLSLRDIRLILKSGKPVVWTMHDFWPATGICHYPLTCEHFKSVCKECPLLPGGGAEHDLAWRIWNRKMDLLKSGSIYFVACSQWLKEQVQQSGLFVGQRLTEIPNPVDTRLFRSLDQKDARQSVGLPVDKQLILFVSQRVTDGRKGMDYFIRAIRKLVEKDPEMPQHTGVVILGGHSEEMESQLALPVYAQGYVNDERTMVQIYNAVDVFVLPSLQDNLPNTIMEAMACGTPCVGFRTGGIPEMIDHRINGYVASYKDVEDLAAGIYWVLREADRDELGRECLRKVAQKYSQRAVALKYIDVYNQAMAFKHYRL